MEIDKKLYEDIKAYCKLNNLKVGEYVNGLLKKAFMEDKYGASPFERFGRKMLDGMKEAEETEAQIAKEMEEKGLEPVSMEDLIFDESDEKPFVTPPVAEIVENKPMNPPSGKSLEVLADVVEKKKTVKRSITVK